MTEQTTISDIGFRAMVDFAAQPGNEQSLANGSNGLNESVEVQIVRELFTRLEIPEVLERVKYGHHQGEDLNALAWKVAKTYGIRHLHDLMELLKATHTTWPCTWGFSKFSETYWDIVIRDRIERGDYRRTWDDIRKAAREQKPFDIKPDEVERHLRTLIRKMENEKVIESKSMSGTHHFRHQTPVHGLSFILELYPQCKWRRYVTWAGPHPRFIENGSYQFEYVEGIIMQLAEHFAKERNKKRGKKAARQH